MFHKPHFYVALLIGLVSGVFLYTFFASNPLPPKTAFALKGDAAAALVSASPSDQKKTLSSSDTQDSSEGEGGEKAALSSPSASAKSVESAENTPIEAASDAAQESEEGEPQQEKAPVSGEEAASEKEGALAVKKAPEDGSVVPDQTPLDEKKLEAEPSLKEVSPSILPEGEGGTPKDQAQAEDNSQSQDAPQEASQNSADAPYTNPENMPEIMIVVEGLGRRQETLELSLALPREITLAFYSFEGVETASEAARRDGHETLLMVPMEPLDYPENDPGPMTLLTGLEASENKSRLEAHLENMPACVGVMPFQGSRFLISKKDLEPFFKALKDRDLFFIESPQTPKSVAQKLASKKSFESQHFAHRLDGDPTREAVLKELHALEKKAIQEGRAYGVTQDVPMILETLRAWSEKLSDRKIRLAPASICFTKRAP